MILIRFARQWIAGETLDDAIPGEGKANSKGPGAIINFPGEHVRDKEFSFVFIIIFQLCKDQRDNIY
jgi:hypothetical protein